MNHTHAERYWHRHEHRHVDRSKGLNGWEPEDGGQYYWKNHWHAHQHVSARTHEHGDGGEASHSHKSRRYHPRDDEVTEHHGPPGKGPCAVCGLSVPADPDGFHEAGHEDAWLTHKDKED